MTVLALSGYAALLPVAPLWAVHGGAGPTGAGLVNGVLMLATVPTQLAVPTALRRLGWAPVLVAGMLLLGLPSAALGVGDGLVPVLVISAVRGLGFGAARRARPTRPPHAEERREEKRDGGHQPT